jgi:hypothetical protein
VVLFEIVEVRKVIRNDRSMRVVLEAWEESKSLFDLNSMVKAERSLTWRSGLQGIVKHKESILL